MYRMKKGENSGVRSGGQLEEQPGEKAGPEMSAQIRGWLYGCTDGWKHVCMQLHAKSPNQLV